MASGIDWFRWHHGAKGVYEISLGLAREKRTCYPNWGQVEKLSGLSHEVFLEAFDSLCEAGVVFNGLPSFLVELESYFPMAPIFGPLYSSRPSGPVWAEIRKSIFARDNYTCGYCGAHGVRLECDHVIPVANGGSHDDSNLVTACFNCNRSKGSKSIGEWEASRGW